jgi:hypothetical protein
MGNGYDNVAVGDDSDKLAVGVCYRDRTDTLGFHLRRQLEEWGLDSGGNYGSAD